jgi:MoaA/NifB/PqqE/SkfB family radical SAM enzyme
MAEYDLLSLDYRLEGEKLVAEAGGPLGKILQPAVDKFVGTLNGLKVIAKKDGMNVYNLYNPPQPSAAGMRHLFRTVKRMVYGVPFPGTANLAITLKCQCKCVHCSADPFRDSARRELTTDELKSVVDQAQGLGASLIIFVGGEPLLRKDVYELVGYVDKNRAVPMIFTNGILLTEDNVRRLADNGLYSAYLSIDSPDPGEHNELRQTSELFEKTLAGAKRCMDHGILTGLSTYMTSERLREGKLEKLLDFAQREGFNEVTIFDCIPSGKFLKREDLILSVEEKEEIARVALGYHNSSHPMGVIAMCVVNSPQGGGCFGAYSQFYMTAYGDIDPCDFNPITFGNVLEEPLEKIWWKMVKHPDFSERHLTCRMQTEGYRAKYIRPMPDDVELPVSIEEYL